MTRFLLSAALICLSSCTRTKEDVTKVLAIYGVTVDELSCTAARSRSQECTFSIQPQNIERFSEAVSKDHLALHAPVQPPARIHEHLCDLKASDSIKVIRAGRAGNPSGGSLPYIGTVRVDEVSGKGCLYVEYGYG